VVFLVIIKLGFEEKLSEEKDRWRFSPSRVVAMFCAVNSARELIWH
jgi:hypothetical protein